MSDKEPKSAPRWFPMSPVVSRPSDSPPPSVNVLVEFGARSRRGPRRPINDDHYLILRLGRHQEALMTSLSAHEVPPRFEEFAYGMVIADGMGVQGDAASRLAIASLAHMAVHVGRWNVRIDETIAQEVMDRVDRLYRGIDSALFLAGRDTPAGLQTTLTGVFSAGSELFVAHVGHSRAYLLRDGKLLRLTRDSSPAREHQDKVVSMDVAAGARDLPAAPTDAIGMAGESGPKISVERCGLCDDDIVLLCTNGLTDVVDEERIENALRAYRSPDDQCRALVGLVVEAGGEDDVTVLVARYRIPEPH